jgi:hypothetical protein
VYGLGLKWNTELKKKSKGLESLSKTFESRLKLSNDLKHIKAYKKPYKPSQER